MLHAYINKIPGLILITVCLAISVIARADGGAATPGTDTHHYLAPEELTQEDYAMMSDYAYRYDSCLNQVSLEQMDKLPDPRHVVDYAMKQCASELEELDRKMIARNIDPDYRQGYINIVNRKSVSETLSNVMMGMASRQSQTPAPVQ